MKISWTSCSVQSIATTTRPYRRIILQSVIALVSFIEAGFVYFQQLCIDYNMSSIYKIIRSYLNKFNLPYKNVLCNCAYRTYCTQFQLCFFFFVAPIYKKKIFESVALITTKRVIANDPKMLNRKLSRLN